LYLKFEDTRAPLGENERLIFLSGSECASRRSVLVRRCGSATAPVVDCLWRAPAALSDDQPESPGGPGQAVPCYRRRYLVISAR